MEMGFQENKQNQEFASQVANLIEIGSGHYGCSHYRRRCKIRAPCCDEVFDCRHCHNEAKDSLQTEQLHRHDLPRHDVSKVICSLCETEQDVQQNCSNCGVCMGKYFCSKCKFFDDDLSKKQYHCDECGICRTGGEENFFHCKRCRCCYSKVMEDKHRCVEGAMHHNCPVCFEYLFDSTRDITVLRCGHTMHLECTKDMRLHSRYSCPVCSKSICDMSNLWKKLDEEVAAYPMPKLYEDKMIWILCNDCGSNTNVRFHMIGHKCSSCGSYNTRQTQRGPDTHCCSSGVPQRDEKKTKQLLHSHTSLEEQEGKSVLMELVEYIQVKAIRSHLLRNFETELMSPFPEIDCKSILWWLVLEEM